MGDECEVLVVSYRITLKRSTNKGNNRRDETKKDIAETKSKHNWRERSMQYEAEKKRWHKDKQNWRIRVKRKIQPKKLRLDQENWWFL
jgi:hypothetical protein